MTPSDIALITGELGPLIKAYVDGAITGLVAVNKALELRVLELETRPEPVRPERGDRGEPGAKGDTGASVASMVLSADHRLIAHYSDGRTQDFGPAPKGSPGERGERGEAGPPGADGRDGLNGKDGEAGPAGKEAPPVDIDAIVAVVLARLPAPEKGERGEQGPAGFDGVPGLNGTNGKDAEPVDVDALVTRVAALMPTPKDGRDGVDGRTGDQGKDGVGVMDAVLDRTGHLILTLSDGRTKEVGIVVGRDGLDGKDGIGTEGAPGRDGRDVDMDAVKALVLSELHTWPRPKDGKDGRDGSWDAVKVDYDKDRTVRLLFKDGTPVEGGVLVFPATIDRGVYEPGKAYARGDGLTHDGHWWVAQADTTETPGDGAKSWRLAVRRGKQGKEGKPGKDAPVLRTTNTPRLYE